MTVTPSSTQPLDSTVDGLDSPWLSSVREQRVPTDDELRAHMLGIHRHHPGFTETCAGRCRDAKGKNSYEHLADHIDPDHMHCVVDLACGSGPLTELCWQRHGEHIDLIGVDMSPDELALARNRLMSSRVRFFQSMAQQLDCLPEASVDLVLCHWALTLMKPIEPVLQEVSRVLRPGGRFVAIIDGDATQSSRYQALDHLVFEHIQRCAPGYGATDLGDPRVRHAPSLADLLRQALGQAAQIETRPHMVGVTGIAPDVAREAVGFFYAARILSRADLEILEQQAAQCLRAFSSHEHRVRFEMPITEMVAVKPKVQ